jgi:bla regulator protein BlaR1
VIARLPETFVAVTALMLLVLALRRPVARFFGAGWAYALWLIPALRLVLPPLGLVPILLPPAGIVIPPAGGGTALPPASAGPGQWVPFMLASWAGGAVLLLILQWLGYRAFARRLDGDSRPARPPFFEGVATFVSRAVEGPVALGLFRRRIVVPDDFGRRYSPAERRLAMAHERTHHRRGDLWWNMAALLVLAVNWFNPVAWLAFRAFRADQELACDAAVAARASAAERCDYARALIKAAAGPGLIAACAMSGTDDLKRRLRMVARHRVGRLRSGGGAAAVAALAVAGFAVGGARPAPPMATAAPKPVHVALAPASAQPVRAASRDMEVAETPRHKARRVAAPVAPAPPEPPQAAANAVEVPAPVDAPDRPAATLQRVRLLLAAQPFDPERRAFVEAAVARALAGAAEAEARLRRAHAETDVDSAVVVRIRFASADQGE